MHVSRGGGTWPLPREARVLGHAWLPGDLQLKPHLSQVWGRGDTRNPAILGPSLLAHWGLWMPRCPFQRSPVPSGWWHAPVHRVQIRSARYRPALSSLWCSKATRWQEGFTFSSVPHPYYKDYQKKKKKTSLKLVLKLCFKTQTIHIITISFEATRLHKRTPEDGEGWLVLAVSAARPASLSSSALLCLQPKPWIHLSSEKAGI